MPSTLAKVPKQTGNPRVLVLSGAALRVADLCRSVACSPALPAWRLPLADDGAPVTRRTVRTLTGVCLGFCREVKTYKTKEVDVVKLFAKHFKLAEHVAHLEKTKVAIAVGTPNRVGKLLSETGKSAVFSLFP